MAFFLEILLLVLLGLAPPPCGAGSIWPKPFNQTSTGRLLYLHPTSFHFASRGYKSRLLLDAFCRYGEILRDAPVLPGFSAQGVLERLGGGKHRPHAIRHVVVLVTSYDQSLSLDTSEAYELRVEAPTTTIQAQTVFGALRALETLAQMVDTLRASDLGEGGAGAAGAGSEEDVAAEVLAVLAEEGGNEGGTDERTGDDGGELVPDCSALDVLSSSHKRRRHRHRRVHVLEECVVEDMPRFKHRGLLIDTARHFLPLPIIKKHLDAMAMSKLNVLHWHIVDDQSFPLELEDLPRLSEQGAFSKGLVYTASDVREVVEYARDRGIRVIPELDTPGHTLSWGRGYPDVLTPCYGPSGHPTDELGPLNPARPATYALVWRLLSEVARLFPDDYVHLGGDEVDLTCWKSNPEVAGWVEEHGWGADFAEAAQYFESEVLRLAVEAGKRSIVWQEVFDSLRPGKTKIRRDTVVQVWKWWAETPAEQQSAGSPGQARGLLSSIREFAEQAQHDLFPWSWRQEPQEEQGVLGQKGQEGSAEMEGQQPAWAAELHRVTKAGYRALLSAPWYLNLGQFAGEDWAAYYQVEPVGPHVPPQQAALVVGGEACMWGEYVDETNAIPRTWPRAAAVAERLWSDESVRDVGDARRRLQEHRCRMLARGIQASPLGPGACPSVDSYAGN